MLTLPTDLERLGDFSQTRNANGQPVVIFDPLTTRTVNGAIVRDPFPGNVIPADRINPVARAMLAADADADHRVVPSTARPRSTTVRRTRRR